MLIRPVEPADSKEWERMRQALWPSPPGEHASEIERYFKGDRNDPAAVLMALDGTGRPTGFAELSIRFHAEGCTSHRVAYLEGWFVEPSGRRRRSRASCRGLGSRPGLHGVRIGYRDGQRRERRGPQGAGF